MESTRRNGLLLAALFVAIISVEGPVQAVLDWRGEGRPQIVALFRQAPTQDNLRDFETALEASSWSGAAARPAIQYARFALLGAMGDKAILGRDGWLFYRPGVDFLTQPWDPVGAPAPGGPLRAIIDLQRDLALRDVALLIVVAPGKASIYPEQLSRRGGGRGVEIQRHARAFMDRLDGAGVPYVNLHEIFGAARAGGGEPLYLARDTHWSPAGVALAAEAVAARVLAEGWVAAGTTAYGVTPVAISREGDVLRMADSPRIGRAFRPEVVTCMRVTTPEGLPYDDDPDAPVLVLGDSFLRVYQTDAPGSAGFIAHLAREMGQPVASIVSDGGASTLVRQELARRPALLAGKKVVIWEFVERDLRFGLEGWRPVPLPPQGPMGAR